MIYVESIKRNLPDLFAVIINTDRKMKTLTEPKVISLIDLKSYKELRDERRRFTEAAEKFIQKQKGSDQ